MKVYLSGPMTGYPNNNEETFRTAAASLRAAGYKVTSPTELDAGEDLSRDATVDEYERLLERDLKVVRQHEGIVLLPGWERSGGVGREGRVAIEAGLRLFEWIPEQPQRLVPLSVKHFLKHSTVKRAEAVYARPARLFTQTITATNVYHVHVAGDYPVDTFYFCCPICGACGKHRYAMQTAADEAVIHYKEHLDNG